MRIRKLLLLAGSFAALFSVLARRATATPFAYVGSSGPNVSVIDTATDTIVTTIPVDAAVGGIVVSPDGSRVYVTPYSIKVIDTATNTVIATVPNFGTTFSPVLSPDGTRLYVLNYPGGSNDILQVIDTASNTTLTTVTIPGNITKIY